MLEEPYNIDVHGIIEEECERTGVPIELFYGRWPMPHLPGKRRVCSMLRNEREGNGGDLAACGEACEARRSPGGGAPPREDSLEENSGADQTVSLALNAQQRCPTRKFEYGSKLKRQEAEVMAEYIRSGKRIPRRGEIGYSAEEIERFESLGYVMGGNKRMAAVRVRKEMQVYAAERPDVKDAVEKNKKREVVLNEKFKAMLAKR